jgi:hypothetical protein
MSKGKIRPLTLVRPWGPVWQQWTAEHPHSGPWTSGADVELDAMHVNPPALLAAPARLTIAVPLWLAATDASLFSDMARLELEVRGLLSRSAGDNAFSLVPVSEEAERTLVLACCFPSNLPDPLRDPAFERFEPSPILATLPADACSLWLEGDEYVAAFTRGAQVVYWETFDAPAPADAVTTWLERIALQLASEDILTATPAFCSFLRAMHDIPAPAFFSGALPPERRAGGPTPRVPEKRFHWKPPHRLELERRATQFARRRQLVTAAVASYVVFLLIIGFWAAWLGFTASRLTSKLTATAPEVARIQQAAAEWELLAPSIESDYYPIEVLFRIHRIIQTMPDAKIRLTDFTFKAGGADTRPGQIAPADIDLTRRVVTVAGEALDTLVASEFIASMKSDEELRSISWSQPALIPGSGKTATFTIQGDILYEEPQS